MLTFEVTLVCRAPTVAGDFGPEHLVWHVVIDVTADAADQKVFIVLFSGLGVGIQEVGRDSTECTRHDAVPSCEREVLTGLECVRR
ncbi:hypothetical protein COT97_01790 [Candidatus Falkowbacteria bacterium CG10_big_fil_rev_8_21_14_0_10_39_11]|uniref:Uncharacterized protein n=1 Tax=Candidatus Falkowbacteria bacterium CG10_big_fil_rev_8_21_14_0_10_39_11 TaxID=1974565 RepID=A0A2H0V5J3_9BACT|nr:MAG: hypothetical protein COT97_01790 [Candidatus Falkowbacteria bacterium CG10_big_fil_rev_8_21_14_0_10_39_11]